MGVRFLEEGIEWKLPGILYADNVVLWGELEGDLKVMRHFVEVYKSGLKLKADTSKVMVLGGEEGLVCISQLKILPKNITIL